MKLCNSKEEYAFNEQMPACVLQKQNIVYLLWK